MAKAGIFQLKFTPPPRIGPSSPPPRCVGNCALGAFVGVGVLACFLAPTCPHLLWEVLDAAPGFHHHLRDRSVMIMGRDKRGTLIAPHKNALSLERQWGGRGEADSYDQLVSFVTGGDPGDKCAPRGPFRVLYRVIKYSHIAAAPPHFSVIFWNGIFFLNGWVQTPPPGPENPRGWDSEKPAVAGWRKMITTGPRKPPIGGLRSNPQAGACPFPRWPT